MRIALAQTAPRLLRVDENLRRAEALLQGIAADLYVLPELFASGYTFATPAEVAAVAEAADAGPTFDSISALARRRQAWVVYGFPERAAGSFYNAANVVGPAGWVATYRKIHLFSREKLFFAPGTEAAPVIDLPWGRIGLMICFDWYFPEIARSLALRGAEALIQPANLVLPHCPQAMITRSLENRVFSVTCDRIGEEENGSVHHQFIGQSQVVTPTGQLLTRLSSDREETAVVEADLAQARSKRVGSYNDLFADRQPSLYV